LRAALELPDAPLGSQVLESTPLLRRVWQHYDEVSAGPAK